MDTCSECNNKKYTKHNLLPSVVWCGKRSKNSRVDLAKLTQIWIIQCWCCCEWNLRVILGMIMRSIHTEGHSQRWVSLIYAVRVWMWECGLGCILYVCVWERYGCWQTIYLSMLQLLSIWHSQTHLQTFTVRYTTEQGWLNVSLCPRARQKKTLSTDGLLEQKEAAPGEHISVIGKHQGLFVNTEKVVPSRSLAEAL